METIDVIYQELILIVSIKIQQNNNVYIARIIFTFLTREPWPAFVEQRKNITGIVGLVKGLWYKNVFKVKNKKIIL